MTDITLRGTKGAPLTHQELDDNFANLKETADSAYDASVAIGGKANASALGTDAAATNMGTTPGTILSDNGTAKDWFQESETAIEARPTSSTLAASSGSSLLGFLQAGTGATARTLQDKARESFSVKDFGATGLGVVNEAAAFAAAAVAGACMSVPAGAYSLTTTPAVSGTLIDIDKGATLNGSGAAAIGYVGANTMRQTLHNGTVPDQWATRYYRRNASHTGGTAGFTSAGLRVDTYVGAGVTNYEWTAIFLMDNSATAGQNTAVYGQGIKRATGPTWAATLEVIDTTGANPTTGAIGAEVDVRANGTDNNNQRVGVDVVVSRQLVAGAPSGTAMEAGFGVRVQTTGDASATVKIGYGFGNSTKVGIAYDASAATVTGQAFKMAQDQVLAFNAAANRTLRHNGGGWCFNADGTDVAIFIDSGALWLGSTQVLGTRRTGWTAATGTATRTTFATGSVTLPVLAEHVKALIDDCISHGLIGA